MTFEKLLKDVKYYTRNNQHTMARLRIAMYYHLIKNVKIIVGIQSMLEIAQSPAAREVLFDYREVIIKDMFNNMREYKTDTKEHLDQLWSAL